MPLTKSCIISIVPYIASSRILLRKEATSQGVMAVAERWSPWVPCVFFNILKRLLKQSIYGGKFSDDKAGLKVEPRKGSLAMANSGKNSNSSQFFIVLTEDDGKIAKLNGKHVVFGRLKEGWEVLLRLDEVGTEDGRPTQMVWIGGCGKL